jgi:hypothetical protein
MKSFLVLLAGGLMFVTTYAGNAGAAATGPNLHDLMKNVVAVQAQVVWDVSNQAQDAEGNPDASKLKPADWGKIAAAAGKLKQAAQALAQAEHVMAAAPGQKLDGEDAPGAFGAKQVQATIDKSPQVFHAFAQALVASMDQIATATQSKDAAKLFDVAGRLDQVCEDCHVQFWYPNQKTPR